MVLDHLGRSDAARRASHFVDVAALEGDLRDALSGEVRFDAGARGLYSTDASSYREVPIGVVIPRTTEDVQAAMEVCHRHDAPVLSRGGGTSLAGQCCNVAVVLDFSKYLHEVLEIDPDRRVARVQPGAILDHLRDAATADHGLTFGPDPSTHDHCTFGGMVGNNSCGTHSMLAGPDRSRVSDNLASLEVLTYDGHRLEVGATGDRELESIIAAGGRRGEIYRSLRDLRDHYADVIRARMPRIPRRVSGYNLDDLLPENGFDVARALAGSEGTLVTILEATVELVEWPPVQSLLVLGFDDIAAAADAVPEVRSHGPMGLEGIDEELVALMEEKGLHPGSEKLLPEGKGWLLVEFGGGDKQEADDKARACMKALRAASFDPSTKLYDEPETEQRIWEVREAGLGATAYSRQYGDAWEGWEDAAVPPERLGDYLRDFKELLKRHGYTTALYGHFGQGCVHCRINFDLRTRRGIDAYRSFVHEAAGVVVSYGGSISGEHGDGQSRGELLPLMYGDEMMQAFREFKSIWDPRNRMNPGKVIDAAPLDSHLKLDPGHYRPTEVTTHFSYPEDGGDFAHAANRCVGIGKCRRTDGGTMCPSYMVTREEEHSTRGRARMLFEMLQGDPVGDGWRDQSVFDALELCLSCKGCKGDCPVSVDMASYKAEFLSHFYEGRLRPPAAYAMGLIYWWSRLASKAPHLVNFLTHAPVLRTALKRPAGLAQGRAAPKFAAEPFRRWWQRRSAPSEDRPPVILWADTFNNFMHTEVAKAAVEVLEDAGYRAELPGRVLCCGRPLYDFGMLDLAKRQLRQTIATLRPALVEGTPIVGIEPSCVAVFRDELPNLLPHDQDAQRLAKQFTNLSEFLIEEADYSPPRLERKALVHRHCHHEAVMGFDADKELLSRIGLDFEYTDAGCCGLAGSFGFEAGDKFDVSMAAGERKLAPMVRAAEDDTVIIADGFSCKTQIEQLTDRRALHTAQVLKLALDGAACDGRRPEEGRPDVRAGGRPSAVECAAIGAAAVGVGLGLMRRRLS